MADATVLTKRASIGSTLATFVKQAAITRIYRLLFKVKIWFQNHRYKIRRVGGKVSDEEASVTQPKVRAVEGSVTSANSWDSSLSEGYGNADSMQSQQGPQQTMPPLQQVPARQGAYMLATPKYTLKSPAQLLENQLNTKIDIRQDAEDEERKKCSELTK
ncbi:hypothetical protein TSMEX_007968 [Taenia solium]|eukprot:TsM_001096000 transcript=TsM_001096000 gene=TsM_001096000